MSTIATEGKPAFDTLVESHGRELFDYLWRMLGNDQDAEDCLQEAFIRAYRAYARLDDAGAFTRPVNEIVDPVEKVKKCYFHCFWDQ